MDKTLKYQNAIISLLQEFAEFWKSSKGVKNQVIADKENHIYQLNMFGWQESQMYSQRKGVLGAIRSSRFKPYPLPTE